MNRSALMVSIFVGFGFLGFVGCGDTENTKNERSSSTEETGDNIDLNVGADAVEFSVLPPSDSNEGLALRSLAAPDAVPPAEKEEDGQAEPKPTEPPVEQSSRITITCKREVPQPLAESKDQVSDRILPMLPSFTIGLEESTRDGSVGYESQSFSYACGKEGALVSIKKLSPKAKYKLDATYANTNGIATHKGEASFQISEGTTALVKLYMKKIEPRSGSVDVDIIFGKDKKGTKVDSCKNIDTVCAEIYAPVVCQGTATPIDGRDIALVIGPIKGSNECAAKALLAAEACKQNAELMPEVSCKPIK